MGVILPGEPFSQEKTQEIVDQFFRDGFVHIPNVLTPAEVKALINKTDEVMGNPDIPLSMKSLAGGSSHVQLWEDKNTGKNVPFILRNCIEADEIFRQMLVREPIFNLAEAIVGEDSKYCGQNVIRNLQGLSIEKWHCDSKPYFPLPDEIKRHDSRIRMPVLWLTVQIPLTDVESLEYGPTQYIPGSHYSGRIPPDKETPKFDNNDPVSVFCKAGDIYLHDPMCWHRGAPNTSNRTRYLFQSQYAANWAYTRFHLYNQVPVDKNNLVQSSDKLLNFLGRSRPNRE